MTFRLRELVTVSDVDAMFTDLAAIYVTAESAPETVILCPLQNPMPIPSLDSFRQFLGDPSIRLFIVDDNVSGALLHVTVLVNGAVTAAWGPVMPSVMIQFAGLIADALAPVGWVLNTGVAGWVARIYFETYIAQDGGPFDVSVRQPGMPAGTSYNDFDAVLWKLTISRRGGVGPFSWIVELL